MVTYFLSAAFFDATTPPATAAAIMMTVAMPKTIQNVLLFSPQIVVVPWPDFS